MSASSLGKLECTRAHYDASEGKLKNSNVSGACCDLLESPTVAKSEV